MKKKKAAVGAIVVSAVVLAVLLPAALLPVQAATNPVPSPNAAFMPIEPMKPPESLDEFEKMMEERYGQRFPEQQMEERKVVQGTYFDITGNFAILWEESEDVNSTWAWIIGDLDGDGSDDVLVHQYKYDYTTDTRMEKVIAKKGSDGTHLWEESITTTYPDYGGIYAYPVGDLDGDGSDDVLVHQYKYDYTTDTRMEKVIAKKGSDGTHLWEESVSITGGYCSIYGYPAGDLDGDGLNDVLVQLYKYVDATDTRTEKVIAKKGSDGTHLWEESITTTYPDYGGIWAMPAGDLDGDGLNDMLVSVYKYDYTTGAYTYTVIAKRGFDGNHIWEATSDEYIWIAMPYYPYPYYYYAEPKIAQPEPVPVPGGKPSMPGYESMEWRYYINESMEWGYDLNGDGIDDVVLGSSNIIYALTYSPGPKIDIYTDKSIYKAGDKMHLGLNVTNPGEKQKVSVKIWLETPVGKSITLIDTNVTLPAGLNYVKPSFRVFKLPNIPNGTYVWHAVLDYPATGEVLSEDTAKWDFVGGERAATVDITEVLQPIATIKFGE